MRLLLYLSIVSLIGLALSCKADAQTSDEILRSAYCYGAFSDLENGFLTFLKMPMNPSDQLMLQQAVGELDHDKKEFLGYLIANEALGLLGTALAVKQGENDEDLMMRLGIGQSESDAILNKIKGCYTVAAQLPF